MFLDVILDGIFDQVLGLFHHQFEELLISSKAYDDTTRHMVKWIKEVLIIDALPKLEVRVFLLGIFEFSSLSRNRTSRFDEEIRGKDYFLLACSWLANVGNFY